MLTAGWFWLTIAIGVFWALGAYNRLVRLQSQVQQSFDALELRLLEFAELVQQVLRTLVAGMVVAMVLVPVLVVAVVVLLTCVGRLL